MRLGRTYVQRRFVNVGIPAHQRYIIVTLFSRAGVARANLTGLKWAVHNEVTPDLWTAPTDKGAAGTTDSGGSCLMYIPNSAKGVGQAVSFVITDSDGNPIPIPPYYNATFGVTQVQ